MQNKRAQGVTQWFRELSAKARGTEFKSLSPLKNLGKVTGAYDPSIGETKILDPQVSLVSQESRIPQHTCLCIHIYRIPLTHRHIHIQRMSEEKYPGQLMAQVADLGIFLLQSASITQQICQIDFGNLTQRHSWEERISIEKWPPSVRGALS